MKFILDDLKERNLVKQVTNEEKLKKAQEINSGVYCGIDPTANSLHIGHLVQLLNLKRFYEFGFKPLAVIGGATGMIGDPSFKSQERKLLSAEEVNLNVVAIKKQIKNLIPSVEVINNETWLASISLIDFLREIGKDFNLAYLLAKENISSRIETGLSITEFSYAMLQAYDFYWLYKTKNCYVQLGGSDQWGNITCGTDYISSKIGNNNSKACGITINLLTKKDGVKFGKTESGTIWLDREKTSEYEFYQFFFNQDDQDLEILFYFLTTLPVKDIQKILQDHNKEPFKRNGQKILAAEITKWVHGENGLQQAVRITESFFQGKLHLLAKEELKAISNSIPNSVVNKNLTFIEFLVNSKISSSNREARELINDKAISILTKNDFLESDIIDEKYYSYENVVIVKKGKKKYFSVKCV